MVDSANSRGVKRGKRGFSRVSLTRKAYFSSLIFISSLERSLQRQRFGTTNNSKNTDCFAV